MRQCSTIKVFGRVQGVFFRHSARHEAEKLGLRGFVKNEDDGSVYMEVEGEEENIRKFVEWCRKGPPFANVERVEEQWGTGNGRFSSFEIL